MNDGFSPRNRLPRRTVLRGLGADPGAAVARRDACRRSRCAPAPRKPVHRFQTFYVPNGMAMEYWTPKGEGAAFELSPILEPLAPYRDQMLVLSGLKANWNYIHAGASGSFLTGTTRGGRNEVEIIADVSMDQLLARHFAKETQLGVARARHGRAGQRRRLHRQSELRLHAHASSWRSPTQPLPMEYNPRAVFEKLFGDSGSTDRAAREARLRQHKSILDSVTDKLAGAQARAGPAGSGARSNEYAESVRDVERRIQKAEEQRDLDLPTIDQPQGVPPVFEDHLDADARSAGAGVSVRSDARHLVHDQQGAERAALSADWRARSASSPVASRRPPELIAQHVEDQPLSHRAVRAVPRRSCARRPTATARCSIT